MVSEEKRSLLHQSIKESIASRIQSPTVIVAEKASVFVGMLTIVGTIIGGGVVGIPFAMLKMGLILGFILNVVNIFLNLFSVQLLLDTQKITGLGSYSELGFHCFGSASIYIINFVVAVAQVGMPIAYFIIFAHVGTPLLKKIDSETDAFWVQDWFAIIVLAVLLMIFVIKKEIQELKIASLVLFIGIIGFLVVLGIRLISGKHDGGDTDFWVPDIDEEAIGTIPTVLLAYAFQTAFFPVYESLKEKTYSNGIKMSLYSMLFVFVMYIGISFVALYSFRYNIKPDMLENLASADDGYAIVMQICFLAIAAMHIPIVFFVGKEAVLIMVDECTRGSLAKSRNEKLVVHDDVTDEDIRRDINRATPNDYTGPYQPQAAPTRNIDDVMAKSLRAKDSVINKKHGQSTKEPMAYMSMSPFLYYPVSIGIYGLVVLAACTVDIEVVFGFVGSTAVTMIVYILPAGFYLKSASLSRTPLSTGRKVGVWLFLIFGIICFVGLNGITIYNLVKTDDPKPDEY